MFWPYASNDASPHESTADVVKEKGRPKNILESSIHITHKQSAVNMKMKEYMCLAFSTWILHMFLKCIKC